MPNRRSTSLPPAIARRKFHFVSYRTTVSAGWFVLLAFTSALPCDRATAGDKARTGEQLQAVLRQKNYAPCAFINGDPLRLYFTNAKQRLIFKADWDRARLRTQDFSSSFVISCIIAPPLI